MVKRIFLFFICVFSLAAGSRCYSGCCFSRPRQQTTSNIEAERLLAAKIKRSSPPTSRKTSPRRSASPFQSGIVNEDKSERQLSTSSTPTQAIDFGERQIILPGVMKVTHDQRGFQLAALPTACHIFVFPEYASAVKQNAHVGQLHDKERSRPKSFGDLKLKLETVYADMRAEAERAQTVDVTEAIIRSLQATVDQMDETAEQVPAKTERDSKKRASRTMIIQNGAVILLLVPNPEGSR
ncbi:MAG: hypothetical protein JNJ47_03255 [Alphaproteobacteria bacterium]|nr:hypothetical protein [Alphaproteobacteria bacterium]